MPKGGEISEICACCYCVMICILDLEKAVIRRLVSEGWEIYKGWRGSPLLPTIPFSLEVYHC